ncbi:homocysteine S-methyltransferase [Prauserella cavernicola]|uniref:Homocysteine S-methyltransferase n=1 Tax=Prauserella cavernicola TaxID=2800127 RepID=A0A934QZQ5_9PSEU|nr:homocysteine S-methyltransferase [Prauserella cavernicola]MBK1788264.1 homocysteine S-methyltransferase [Prauserella cavernicola]
MFSSGGPVLLDGGLATELEARGYDLSDSLWSARLLADDPDAIVAAHTAFFRAGAEVATTASYQASFPGFATRGIGTAEAARLMRRSVELARRARDAVAGDSSGTAPGGATDDASGGDADGASGRTGDRTGSRNGDQTGGWSGGRTGGWSGGAFDTSGGRRRVAASVGPYGAVLADGSEYRGRYGLSHRELLAFHRPRLEVLAEAKPDLIAFETVPDVDEAVAELDALESVDVPAWLSYTVAGGRTRAGQRLEDAFAVAAERERVLAVGVNCCSPDEVADAVVIAREVTGKPVVVYPNSGEGWDARNRRWTGRSAFSPGGVNQWIVEGAALVGGCCRVRPGDIADLARSLGLT